MLRKAVVPVSLVNCKQCGKLHLQKSSSLYCTDCLGPNNQLSRDIRNYLKAHPQATVMDVHREMGVPLEKVLEYQREYTYS
jgi:hypothetical protein